jgi:hypothetical protein
VGIHCEERITGEERHITGDTGTRGERSTKWSHREQYKFGSIGTHRDHEEASGTVFVVESTTFEDQREFLHAGG